MGRVKNSSVVPACLSSSVSKSATCLLVKGDRIPEVFRGQPLLHTSKRENELFAVMLLSSATLISVVLQVWKFLCMQSALCQQ